MAKTYRVDHAFNYVHPTTGEETFFGRENQHEIPERMTKTDIAAKVAREYLVEINVPDEPRARRAGAGSPATVRVPGSPPSAAQPTAPKKRRAAKTAKQPAKKPAEPKKAEPQREG